MRPFAPSTVARRSVYIYLPTSRVGRLQPPSRTATGNASGSSALFPSCLDSPSCRSTDNSWPLTEVDTNSIESPRLCRALSLITRREDYGVLNYIEVLATCLGEKGPPLVYEYSVRASYIGPQTAPTGKIGACGLFVKNIHRLPGRTQLEIEGFK